MQRDERLGQSEAEPGSRREARIGIVGALEGSADAGEDLARHAEPGVEHGDAQAIGDGPDIERHAAAARGEFERVRQQVEQDLLDRAAIGDEIAGLLGDHDAEIDAERLCAGAHQPRDLGDDLRRRDRLEGEGLLAGLDPGEVEHVVDEIEQMQPAGMDVADIFGEHRRADGADDLGPDKVGETDDRIERRAQLMAHIGEEGGFRAAGFLGPLLLQGEIFGEQPVFRLAAAELLLGSRVPRDLELQLVVDRAQLGGAHRHPMLELARLGLQLAAQLLGLERDAGGMRQLAADDGDRDRGVGVPADAVIAEPGLAETAEAEERRAVHQRRHRADLALRPVVAEQTGPQGAVIDHRQRRLGHGAAQHRLAHRLGAGALHAGRIGLHDVENRPRRHRLRHAHAALRREERAHRDAELTHRVGDADGPSGGERDVLAGERLPAGADQRGERVGRRPAIERQHLLVADRGDRRLESGRAEAVRQRDADLQRGLDDGDQHAVGEGLAAEQHRIGFHPPIIGRGAADDGKVAERPRLQQLEQLVTARIVVARVARREEHGEDRLALARQALPRRRRGIEE